MYPVIKEDDLQPVQIHLLSGRSAMTNFISGDKITEKEASKLWNSQVYLVPATLCKFKLGGVETWQCVENLPVLIAEYIDEYAGDMPSLAEFIVEKTNKSKGEIQIIEFTSGYHILRSSLEHYQKLVSAKYIKLD